jgi:AraC-like DNA-binding protein
MVNGGPAMERRAELPLQRHKIFATGDAEEARAFLEMRGFSLDMLRREAAHLDMRINGVFWPSVYLGYVQYGAAVGVYASEFDEDYYFATPLRGRYRGVVANNDIAWGPGTAMLTSPPLCNFVQADRDTTVIHMMLNASLMRQQLGALLDEPLKAPLEFAPLLSLKEGPGRSLARFARFAIAELERRDTILSEPITGRSFREFIATALLLHQPHNYSESLRRLERRPAAPRDVKRAIDYIEANLDEAIGLSEIATAAGVPGRTLIRHFQDSRGTSPMRYLREARYGKVREVLWRAEPEESITEIALRWGFTHTGRFSVEYRKRFGESPSQTLRRRPAIAVGARSRWEAPEQQRHNG